jgi:hypothetical protein
MTQIFLRLNPDELAVFSQFISMRQPRGRARG